MQQTETYKLNLIETSDTFSPDPLNENTQKLEAALSALGGGSTALDSRITVLEGHKIAIGTYKGSGTVSQTIQVGFTPLVVFAMGENNNPEMATEIFPCRYDVLTIIDGGFVACNSATFMNYSGKSYTYLAIR